MFSLGNKDKICSLPRGKGVGGSSLINCAFYSRGNKKDYDRWANLLNDPGWSYENILPYFKELENFTATNPYVPIDVEYHGYDGPLQMTQGIQDLNISSNIMRGGQELGYNITDYNGEEEIGFSVLQFFTKNGRRYDPGMAFIEPIRNRNNLVVLDRSYVTKIKINTDSKEAEGVVFTRDNNTYIARNRKEVILSAGAFSSPQLLMLSGIGPQEHLESLGIPVIENLPVGKNLHDHTITFVIFSSNITNLTESMEKSVRDFLKGEGSLTVSFPISAISFLQSPLQKIDNYPDIELVYSNLSNYALAQKFFGWTDETLNAISGKSNNTFVTFLTPAHPKSKGSVILKSSNPFDYPIIDSNILSNIEDMEVLYENVQFALKMTDTDAFRRMNISLAIDRFPGCNHLKSLSKEWWWCYIRHTTGTGFHPLSSCLTGTGPKTGVVDKNLKVFGIERLRVADGSVIPFMIAGHPNYACNMIGARVSDIIKVSYNVSDK